MSPFCEWDVAYLLGSLSAGDRQAYEQHLRVCRSCEESVGQLAGMPGVLARVPEDWAVGAQEPVPATLLPRLARSARRTRRWLLVIVLAAVLLAGIVGAATGGAFCS